MSNYAYTDELAFLYENARAIDVGVAAKYNIKPTLERSDDEHEEEPNQDSSSSTNVDNKKDANKDKPIVKETSYTKDVDVNYTVEGINSVMVWNPDTGLLEETELNEEFFINAIDDMYLNEGLFYDYNIIKPRVDTRQAIKQLHDIIKGPVWKKLGVARMPRERSIDRFDENPKGSLLIAYGVNGPKAKHAIENQLAPKAYELGYKIRVTKLNATKTVWADKFFEPDVAAAVSALATGSASHMLHATAAITVAVAIYLEHLTTRDKKQRT